MEMKGASMHRKLLQLVSNLHFWARLNRLGEDMPTGVVTVSDTATLIIPQNTSRQSFYLFNNGAKRVYLGETAADATVADGFPIESSSQLSEDRGENLWKGDVWGICAPGESSEMRYWERRHRG